jgi:hypothetical protein
MRIAWHSFCYVLRFYIQISALQLLSNGLCQLCLLCIILILEKYSRYLDPVNNINKANQQNYTWQSISPNWVEVGVTAT